MLNKEWIELRDKLLFKNTVLTFVDDCRKMRKKYVQEYAAASKERKKEIVDVISEITIDLQSYLLRWNLQATEKKEKIPNENVQAEVLKNYAMLGSWEAGEKIDYIKKEIEKIKKSNLYKMSNMTDKEDINNRWGNDCASGIMQVMRMGAMLVTTNPPIINIERKANGTVWDMVRDEIKKSNVNASPEKLASLFTMNMVLQNCRELRQIFDATNRKFGYVSFQVNPYYSKNADKMAEEIEFVYEELKRELIGTPNIVFKVPGTKESLKVVKRMTAKGIGVNVTGSFSVAQHLAFAEVIEQGCADVSFVVMMSGRLDGPIMEDLKRAGVENFERISRYGSAAVICKSYNLLYMDKKFSKSAILVASLRGPWNIAASITDKKTPIFISVFPNKREEYDSEDRKISPVVDGKIPQDIINKLMLSENFKKAYEIDELPVDQFDDYYPVSITLDVFKKEYEDLMIYMG